MVSGAEPELAYVLTDVFQVNYENGKNMLTI